MSVLPTTDIEQIIFGEQHWPIWNAAPAAVGLTPQTVASIKTAVAAARASYDSAQAARQASKAATTGVKNNVASMHTLLSDAIQAIRLYAETTNNPAIYQTAQIPAPQPPTPPMAPTQPIEMHAGLESNGALTLSWKASTETRGPGGTTLDPSTVGVVYTIKRKLGGQTGFTMIGVAQPSRAGTRGLTSFTDGTLPAGSNGVEYIVQGQRGELVGPASNVFTVTMGISGTGGAVLQIAA